ncbi:alpha-(1,3)-fucosyltransferase 10-like [Saccostrea cucullata]|uniref:alpha-(1,3)-fucosyltransferase 10-like n=1 Tax=Saccostrea cuccullata TaxID=36930 RepID=UPI002ED07CF8
MRIKRWFRCFILCFFVIFLALLLLMLVLAIGASHSGELEMADPIILWWTDGDDQKDIYRKCGDVTCFITGNRSYTRNPLTKVFMFYGTSFQYADLPLPREPHHEWALLHEESPKNNYLFSFEEVMTLFNHTSTFRRESDYPLITQFLESSDWLTSTKYLLCVMEREQQAEKLKLAPVIFTNSACATASDRDGYIRKLMEYIPVDSYGLCLHNRDLPKHLRDSIDGMFHEEFYKLISKYKFAVAIENAICVDYVTEKLWRPLHVGTVPIVLGSTKVKDFFPSNKSAIVVDDYESVEDLAKYLKYLDNNDDEYQQYLDWKKSGISNGYLLSVLREREWIYDYSGNSDGITFFEGFECLVCRRVHENLKRERTGQEKLEFRASRDHYGCPAPVSVDDRGQRTQPSFLLTETFTNMKFIAKALRYHIETNITVDMDSILKTAERIRHQTNQSSIK